MRAVATLARKPSAGNGVDDAAALKRLAKQAGEAAQLLKLLGQREAGFLILCFLTERGEMTVGELANAVKLSQSALSQHLAKLRADRYGRVPPHLADLALSRCRPVARHACPAGAEGASLRLARFRAMSVPADLKVGAMDRVCGRVRQGRPGGNRRAPRRRGLPPQPPADLGGAAVPRRQIRRRAGGRQRHRPARGAFRPPYSRHHLVAERSQRGAPEKHRGVARACGPAEYPFAAADRSVRPGMVCEMHDGSGPANCWRCSAPM